MPIPSMQMPSSGQPPFPLPSYSNPSAPPLFPPSLLTSRHVLPPAPFGRPAPTIPPLGGASNSSEPTLLQHASYSSRTLVIDNMLFLSTSTRLRQLRHALGESGRSTSPNGGGVDELVELAYPTLSGGSPRSSTNPLAERKVAFELPAWEEEEEDELLGEKASGYERMLSVLLERVKLTSGVSTPVPVDSENEDEEEEEEEEEEDDYIVEVEDEEEDDKLPEGVRLRLGLAGVVDVLLARPVCQDPGRSTSSYGSSEVERTIAALGPIIGSAPGLGSLSDHAREVFGRGARGDNDAPAEEEEDETPFTHPSSSPDGSSSTRTFSPSNNTSRRTSLAPQFTTTNGLSPAPERWYDLPPLVLLSLQAEMDSNGGGPSSDVGRWVELTERFLRVSLSLAEAVGSTTIEGEEKRWKARLGRRTMGGFGGTWESDEEESVDEGRTSGEASEDEGGGTSTPRRSTTRRISNPLRRLSGSVPPPPRPPFPNLPSSISTTTSSLRSPPPSSTAGRGSSADRAQLARPTRAWFALLASLLVQIVLCGYLEQSWTGLEGLGVLNVVGLGMSEGDEEGDDGLGAVWRRLVGEGCKGKRRREFERVLERRLNEFVNVPPERTSLRDHLLSLAERYPSLPVERAILRHVGAACSFLGTPELSRGSSTTYSAPRRISLSSLLNPSSPFPTYQQEPPTPPLDPSRAPRRKGISKYFVAPRLRREGVVGVKRGREDGEEGEGEVGREGSARPPLIVVEDWPDPFGIN